MNIIEFAKQYLGKDMPDHLKNQILRLYNNGNVNGQLALSSGRMMGKSTAHAIVKEYVKIQTPEFK